MAAGEATSLISLSVLDLIRHHFAHSGSEHETNPALQSFLAGLSKNRDETLAYGDLVSYIKPNPEVRVTVGTREI